MSKAAIYFNGFSLHVIDLHNLALPADEQVSLGWVKVFSLQVFLQPPIQRTHLQSCPDQWWHMSTPGWVGFLKGWALVFVSVSNLWFEWHRHTHLHLENRLEELYQAIKNRCRQCSTMGDVQNPIFSSFPYFLQWSFLKIVRTLPFFDFLRVWIKKSVSEKLWKTIWCVSF